MARAKGDNEARERGWVARAPGRHMPPAESELWPEHCRGKNWTWEAARFYVGRCQLCAYSSQPSEGRRRLDRLANLPTFLVCTNHPDSPGQLRDALPTDTCRNFKERQWIAERPRKVKPDDATAESDDTIRRIPLGHDRFAIVDAADYEWLSQYKWCASNKRGTIYAIRRTKKGKTLYMHREITKARKGEVVDHTDHNTLNNRRCNVRAGTKAQNYANMGPHGGASGYVGVYPRGGKWEAGITWRGKHYYLGRYDDPIAAAKARDRKAYALHGPYAYLNFPEDFPRRQGRSCGRRD